MMSMRVCPVSAGAQPGSAYGAVVRGQTQDRTGPGGELLFSITALLNRAPF